MPSLTTANASGTVNQLFAESAQRSPDTLALTYRQGKEWRSITFGELQAKQKAMSLGLRALGIEPSSRVAILSENRPEWAIADLAILALAGVTVPIYSTIPASQVAHILADSGAAAVVASDAKQVEKALQAREKAGAKLIVIAMDSSTVKDDVLSFDDVLARGTAAEAALTPSFEELRDSVKPDDLASLVYTSGTTGNPKGAMLTHGNFYAATQGAQAILPFDIPNDIFLSFLPLCHVFERVTYYLALAMGEQTCYTESLFKVQENMAELKPTVMQSVPRLFEAIYERVLDTVSKAPANRQKLFRWATGVGSSHARRRNDGQMISPILAIQHVFADKLVLGKIRDRFGGRFRFFVSGGAPLHVDSAEFFQGIGIPIIEGYGLTETTAAVAVNPYGRAKIGSVGKPVPNVKVRTADDGELLVSGPTVMKGYWNQPAATDEVIDADGWFHTGDIGVIDSEGYVRITDRKKDIIVLANGKNVAPQPIENELRSLPLVAEAVLLGDKAGTISALIVPNFERLGKWAKESGIQFADNSQLAASAEARKAVKKQVDSISGTLADYEKIRRIALLDHALSIDEGELTPTLKVKRRAVQEKYGHLLD